MPSIGKKRPARGGRGASGKTARVISAAKASNSDSGPSTSKGKTIARSTRAAAARPPSSGTRQHGLVCPHTTRALQENAHDAYKEVLELFVIPSSKSLIPWVSEEFLDKFSFAHSID